MKRIHDKLGSALHERYGAGALAIFHTPLLASMQHLVHAGGPWFIAAVIVVATFVHEDIATVAAGILVADKITDVRVALPALYVGIVVGDIGLYGLGRLIALNRLSRRVAGKPRFHLIKAWLDERLVAGVFLVRFLPGLRLPAYTTYGFFAMPLWRFIVSVILAVIIWTTGLFYLSWKFADLTAHWLGVLRWPVLILAALLPLTVARHLLRDRTSDDLK